MKAYKVQTASEVAPGELIKRLRVERGKGLQDLSNETGIPISTLYRWEAGERVPRDMEIYDSVLNTLGARLIVVED